METFLSPFALSFHQKRVHSAVGSDFISCLVIIFKMSTDKVLNKTLFKSNKIESFKKEFDKAKPFRLIRLQSFLNENFISKLEASLDEHITFAAKDNDLYRFFQSYGLHELPQNTSIQDLIKSLYSNEFRELLFKITGKKVNDKPDLFASCYTDTSYLLCHDDQIEDRSIAFILYLVPSNWNKTDGGALNIYDSYNIPNNDENENKNKIQTHQIIMIIINKSQSMYFLKLSHIHN